MQRTEFQDKGVVDRMAVTILTQPSILMETVEMLYRFVNNLTLENSERDFLSKYADPMDSEYEDGRYYEAVFANLRQIMDDGTRELDRADPRMAYYFRDIMPEGNQRGVCLAKIMLYSFYEGAGFSFEEGLQECRKNFRDFRTQEFTRYKIIGIDRGGLNFLPQDGDCPLSLYRQLESFDLPAACKWEVYRVLQEYDSLLAELETLLRPIAQRMEHILTRHQSVLNRAADYWRRYFASHSFQDFKFDMMGIETEEEAQTETEQVLWFWWMGLAQMHFYQSAHREALNIGLLVRLGKTPKAAGYDQENVLNILKLLSDKSKFDLLRRMTGRRCYGLELANEMGLTSGTISKHLSTLFSCGLLNLQRVNNRVYYQTDEIAVLNFLDQLTEGLLGKPDRT